MKRILGGILVSMVAAGLVCAGESAKPNILFIAIDDLNGYVGALEEHPQVQTPHIDRLAERGVLFSDAHCAAPACNPSRTAVMTGLAPTTSGVYFNQQDWRESSRLEDVATIPEHFRDAGYRVFGGGKLYHASSLNERSHTGLLDPEPWDEFFPSKDRQLVAEALPAAVPTHGNPEFYKGFMDWAALDIDDEEMGDAKVVAWAEEQLSQEHAEPLFLAVGIYRPHIPFYTPQKYFDLYAEESLVMPEIQAGDLDDVPEIGQQMARRHWHEWIDDNDQYRNFVRAYLASASFADAMVGRLINALDEGPMAENTIIVLWSDHGYHLGHKEHWEKFVLWEQATRVPMIFAGQGIEGGRNCEEPVSLLDVYPTLSDLAGIQNPPHLDGVSLVPLLENPDDETGRAVVITQGPGNHAVRSRDWSYIRYEDGSEELYDRNADPREFTNIAAAPDKQAFIDEQAQWLPENEASLDPEKTVRAEKK
ncbi:MAG: sulfatase [Verrucomicrobiota bacterium]